MFNYIEHICLVCLWDNTGEIVWTSLREYACVFRLKYFYYDHEMLRWPFWAMIRASVPRVVNMIIMASSKLFTSILHRLPDYMRKMRSKMRKMRSKMRKMRSKMRKMRTRMSKMRTQFEDARAKCEDAYPNLCSPFGLFGPWFVHLLWHLP
jgi:hypothetical protein